MSLMLHQPFYDPEKSYEENYEKGPFNAFVDGKVYTQPGEPVCEFMGQKVYLPFGIPAGPLLNSRFIKGAFEKGFDITVYKTVRSGIFPCHPFPNVLALHESGDLTMDKLEKPLVADAQYSEPLSITNSFGVPSKDPTIWQEDAKKAISYEGKGQVMVLSFMGTVRENQTQQEFIDDYILAAKLSQETGAKVLEVNLSCPNIGNEGLVCYNVEVTKKVAEGIRNVIGNTPLTLKIGYFKDDAQLKQIAEIAAEYANSIAAINTLQAEVRDKDGNQALPGKNRLRSGVCGHSIKWAGLEMVTRLKKIREDNNLKFSIEGVGGVTTPEDYKEYRDAGADSVMSATGAMWNPLLAQEIKKKYQ
jgi:dihydroorotate dehydrogenase (NAD+) catalytic subunit